MKKIIQKYFIKNYSMDLSCWSWLIILKMILLGHHYIRYYCCYCGKESGFERSTRTGDSGDICSKCLFLECPEVYYEMRDSGKLTKEQILEAEGG